MSVEVCQLLNCTAGNSVVLHNDLLDASLIRPFYSSNVIDRLTRPVSATTPKASSDETMRQFDNSFGDRHVMNVSTFMSSLQGTSTQFQTPGRLRASSAPRERTSSKDLSTADSEQRQRAFKEFISRQLHCSEKRSQHVKEVMVVQEHALSKR